MGHLRVCQRPQTIPYQGVLTCESPLRQENVDTFERLSLFMPSLNIIAVFFPLRLKTIGLRHCFRLAAKYSFQLALIPVAFEADLQQRLLGGEGAYFSSYLFYRSAAVSFIAFIYFTPGNKLRFASRGFAICMARNVPRSKKSSDSAKTTKAQWGINGRKVVNPRCFDAKGSNGKKMKKENAGCSSILQIDFRTVLEKI